MRDAVVTFRLFERILKKKVVEYLFRGKEGPILVFLWVLVAGTLAVFFNLPGLALLWTGVCLGFAGFLGYSYFKNPESMKRIIRSVSKEYFSAEDILRSDLKASTERGIELFSEIAVKLRDIMVKNKGNDDLTRVFSDSAAMLKLLLESARQVEELERILRIIGDGGSFARAGPKTSRRDDAGANDRTSELLRENVETVKNEIREAEATVLEIGKRLETLMLQVFQVEKRASDRIRVSEFARESSETLDRLQAVVEARRETAQEFIRKTGANYGIRTAN